MINADEKHTILSSAQELGIGIYIVGFLFGLLASGLTNTSLSGSIKGFLIALICTGGVFFFQYIAKRSMRKAVEKLQEKYDSYFL